MASEMNEIFDLWKKICNDACEISHGNALSIRPFEDKGDSTQITAQSIYFNTAEKLEKAMRFEKTAFLAPSVIEAALRQLVQVYPVMMWEVLESKERLAARIADIEKLKKLIAEDTQNKEWQRVAAAISQFAASNGRHISENRLQDMAEFTDVLVDAVTVPDKWNRLLVQKGDAGDGEKVQVYWQMPQFFTLAEFYEGVRELPAQNAITFAFIETRHIDREDEFEFWAKGTRSEACRNHTGRGGDVNEAWFGYFALGIKRGEMIWLLAEPKDWDSSPYHMQKFYRYGKRRSYMPYQIAFKETEVKKTDLVLMGKKTWNVLELLDDEQLIWIPTMLEAVKAEFFKKAPEAAEPLVVFGRHILPEIGALPAGKLPMLVTRQPMPDLTKPFEGYAFDTGWDVLLEYFAITPACLADVPLYPSADMNIHSDDLPGFLWARGRKALGGLLSKAMLESYWHFCLGEDGPPKYGNANYGRKRIHFPFHQIFHEHVLKNHEAILAALGDHSSRVFELAEIVINGMPGKKAGSLVLSERFSKVTSVNDGRQYIYSKGTELFFPPTIEGKRPPVCIRIRPETSEDIALLMGIPHSEMDWQFRFWKRKPAQNHNSELRADPISALDNPFNNHQHKIKIAMGKLEFKRVVGKIPKHLPEDAV